MALARTTAINVCSPLDVIYTPLGGLTTAARRGQMLGIYAANVGGGAPPAAGGLVGADRRRRLTAVRWLMNGGHLPAEVVGWHSP
jgi:hypothetical protein